MKNRDSNMEALRIIAILMVLYIHAFGLISGMGYTELGKNTTRLANAVCNTGVSCFILISGYYGITFQWKKLIRMELMVIFYSLCMTLLGAAFFPESMTDSVFELLVKSCIPAASRKYWFYSCYVCLMLMSPFWNRAVEKVGKDLFTWLVGVMLVLFSIFPTFLYFEITMDLGKGLVNMTMLYLAGRWIRMYGDYELKRKNGILLLLILAGVNYLSHVFTIHIAGITLSLTKDNSISNILISVLLLYLFKGFRFRSKLVNRVAEKVFAVFIMNTFVMELVHGYVMKFDRDMIMSNWMPVWITADVLLTFGICIVIEAVRKFLLGSVEDRLTRKISKVGETIATRGRRVKWEKIKRFLFLQ